MLEMLFEVLFVWSGEIILWLVTFGRHKPRWDSYANEESPVRFALLSEASFWVGVIFWGLLIVGGVYLVQWLRG